jgi:hypothetical protein
MSAGLASKRAAAIAAICSRRRVDAWCTAEPAITAERLAELPTPFGIQRVSPRCTVMCSTGT